MFQNNNKKIYNLLNYVNLVVLFRKKINFRILVPDVKLVEIGDINMEIRNNTPAPRPSFGMAFVKPDENSMAALTKYLTKKTKIEEVTSGFSRLLAEQADNAHFDIEYNAAKNSFNVFPTSQEAKEFVQNQSRVFEPDSKYVPEIAKLKKDIKTKFSILKNNGMSAFEIIDFKTKGALKLIKAQFACWVNPKSVLPHNLQEADQYATKMKMAIEEDIYNKKMINSLFPNSANTENEAKTL